MPADPTESLLIFSDVHLGSDLHEAAVNRARRSVSVDRDLVELLAHYRNERPPADRWRIVIAGDFIDFIGMAIAAPPARGTRGAGGALEALATPLNEEEQLHGVGSAADHAVLKLRRVAERHADVFAALAAFVADGHALTVVHGNHDIEFHWDEVKAAFKDILFSHAPHVDREAFAARVEHSPWFFYRRGVAFIEHGHQYDPFCATPNVMAPVSPLDPRRVARGFCDILIRFVVRPTRGMKESGHEHVGLLYYLTFGFRLGASGVVGLFLAFARAVVELFRIRRAQISEAAALLRAEHDRRVAALAEKTRLGVERLRALLSLQTPPVTASIRGIMKSVLLDRLAIALLAVPALVVLALFRAWWACGGVVAGWWALHAWFSSQRSVDPTEALAERAGKLATLFPAAFIVMGHTHVPVCARVPASDATYINLGSWAEDEPEAGEPTSASRAARTHLVIHMKGDAPEAHFLSWEPTGPERREA